MWPIAPFRRLNASALKRLIVPSMGADNEGLGIPGKFWDNLVRRFWGVGEKIITDGSLMSYGEVFKRKFEHPRGQ